AWSPVAPARVDSVLIEWLRELRGMRGERPVSPEEMAFARNQLVAALPARIETNDNVADAIADAMRSGAGLDYYRDYARRVQSVTERDVALAARTYLDLDHLVIVVAGDRKAIEPVLRAANLAPLVFIDEIGRERP